MINKQNLHINDYVYTIIGLGHKTPQIVRYKVGWIGEDSFLPSDFKTFKEKYQIVYFDKCFETLDEAESYLEANISSYKTSHKLN